jgi:hypothetical protein
MENHRTRLFRMVRLLPGTSGQEGDGKQKKAVFTGFHRSLTCWITIKFPLATLQLELDLNVTALRESTNPITGLCCRLPVVLAKPAASKTTSGRQLTARPSERKRGVGEPGCSN